MMFLPEPWLPVCLRVYYVCLSPWMAPQYRVAKRSSLSMDGTAFASLGGNAGAAIVVASAALDFHIPQFDAQAWLQLMILIVSLILCALASAAETALTSISRIKLKNLV